MSLRSKAFSAGRWTTASLLLRALFQFAQTIVLARLLTPEDFGLMAVVIAVYGVLFLVIDLGLSNALIHFPDPSARVLSSLYWLNLLGALVMMLVLIGIAWPVALIYKKAELLPALLVMSLAMPLSALGQQFRVLAEKNLRFNALAVIEVVAALVGFAAAMLVAWLDGGVYAFIAGILTTAACGSVMAWLVLSDGGRPSLHFSFSEVRPYLNYGSFRLGDTLLISAQKQADVLIGGALVGASAMGVYTLPRDLTLRLANTVVNPVVTRVGLPVMAKVQNDRSALKSVYLQTMRMTSSVNFPVYAALAIWAEDVVLLLLGPQWAAAAIYMRIFALWGLVRSTANPVGSLLNATGMVRRAFWWDLCLLIIVPGLLYIALQVGGLVSLAVSMLVIQLMTVYPHYHFLVRPACGATFSEYLMALCPAALSTICAVAGGLAATLLGAHPLARMAVGGLVGAGCYVLASAVLNRSWLVAMHELLRPMFPWPRRTADAHSIRGS